MTEKNNDKFKKERNSLYIKRETYSKIEGIQALSQSKTSRNEVIEKAIDFYYGYLTAEQSQDFLCNAYGQMVKGIIGNLSNRISRQLFKNAVEADILTRLLAADLNISKAEYDKLRKVSLESVKKQNGSVRLLDAVNESV